MSKYTPHQIDILLNGYFREGERPMPYPKIAEAMGLTMGVQEAQELLYYLLWKVITGYGAPVDAEDPKGPRQFKPYLATPTRERRAGAKWTAREDKALREIMTPGSQGQAKEPACTIGHAAIILARTTKETTAKWDEIKAPKGFGLL